jgi:hypothetical protein
MIEIILSMCVLLLIISNIYQYKKNGQLSISLAQSEKNKEDILCVEPGDEGILSKYGLTWTEKQSDGTEKVTSFKVTYEVDIVEVALNQLKVKATNVTPVDTESTIIISDPSKKIGLIKFMSDKWVDKNTVQLVVDNIKRRNDKLNQILT